MSPEERERRGLTWWEFAWLNLSWPQVVLVVGSLIAIALIVVADGMYQ